jgi:hypothetical protein
MFHLADKHHASQDALHSYLSVYRWLFASKCQTARRILEIGINREGRILLWRGYFRDADISVVNSQELVRGPFQNGSFDIIIDSGPQSLRSMQQTLQLYLPLLLPDGIFVIEDVQSPNWIKSLRGVTPAQDRSFIDTYDLRQIRQRYDNILFVINRGVSSTTSEGMLKLLDDSRSDKNTRHSYARTYSSLFYDKMTTARYIMEIGVSKGGSIRMWHDYFRNSHIYGLDIMKYDDMWSRIKGVKRIILYAERDAYNQSFVQQTFQDKNIRFDIIIDDGPHTLQSMQLAILYYLPVLAPDGIFVIEDVQRTEWVALLRNVTPLADSGNVEIYDLRSTKNIHDDILYIINRS